MSRVLLISRSRLMNSRLCRWGSDIVIEIMLERIRV